MLKYNIVWVKNSVGSNLFNIKYHSLQKHEQILIFYSKLKTYNKHLDVGLPYKINCSVTKEGVFFDVQKSTKKIQ